MKAFEISGIKSCRYLDLEPPKLESDDSVIVKVKCVGICGSDIHSYTHGLNTPVIPGHEVVGTVVEAGKNVTKIRVGDHVVLEPLVSCGTCYACRKGKRNVCREAKCLGCQLDGGMREYFQYDQDHWHKIPENLPWKSAVLIEPYTVGLEVVSRGRVQAGDTVLIHGAGPAGLIAMDMANKLGATCIVSEVVEGRLEQARNLGAAYTINPKQEDLRARVKEITNGEGPNVIIDAAGLPFMLEQSVEMVSNAGRIVLMGIGLGEAKFTMIWCTAKEVDIVGSRMQQARFQPVIENCFDYLSHADKLVTDVFPFTQAAEAIALAAQAAPHTAKVVVEFPD